jgi:hypothetical protein
MILILNKNQKPLFKRFKKYIFGKSVPNRVRMAKLSLKNEKSEGD